MSKYLFALSENKTRIHISEAQRGSHGYTCPYCKAPMIAKKGTVDEHHFAHEKNITPCDEWFRKKGEWRIKMQSLFPKECQEVILEADGERHIADVCLSKPNGSKLVVEFQQQSMSNEEFVKRTHFWKSCDADLIWVFNFTQKDFREIPNTRRNEERTYYWSRPYSQFAELITSVPIIFYIEPMIYTAFEWKKDILDAPDTQKRKYIHKPVITSDHKGAPVYVWIDSIGYSSDVLIKAADSDEVITYNLEYKGYAAVTGKQYYDFMDIVDLRRSCLEPQPFVEYPCTIAIRMADKQAYDSDVQSDDCPLNLTQSDSSSFTRVRIYLKKEKKVKTMYLGVDNKSAFIKKIKVRYGKRNVKMFYDDQSG